MDEIAKEYDVIVLGTGPSAFLNPAMWGPFTTVCLKVFSAPEAIALIVVLAVLASILLTVSVLLQV